MIDHLCQSFTQESQHVSNLFLTKPCRGTLSTAIFKNYVLSSTYRREQLGGGELRKHKT